MLYGASKYVPLCQHRALDQQTASFSCRLTVRSIVSLTVIEGDVPILLTILLLWMWVGLISNAHRSHAVGGKRVDVHYATST